MASEAKYDLITPHDDTPHTIPVLDTEDDVNYLNEEQLIVYSEAGVATMDLPEALLAGVQLDTSVYYTDLSSHGDDAEERGERSHVATSLTLDVNLDEKDEELNNSIVRVSKWIIYYEYYAWYVIASC